MPVCQGLDVRVCCGRKRLPEFAVSEEVDEHTGTVTVSAWIMSEAGKVTLFIQ